MSEKNHKILIVDDEKDYSETLSSLLTKEGFKTETADNGNDAIQIIDEQKFDVILSDVRMAHGNGFELIEKIRATNENIMILCMSSFSSYYPSDLMDYGADQFFSKPTDVRALVKYINENLSKKSEETIPQPTVA